MTNTPQTLLLFYYSTTEDFLQDLSLSYVHHSATIFKNEMKRFDPFLTNSLIVIALDSNSLSEQLVYSQDITSVITSIFISSQAFLDSKKPSESLYAIFQFVLQNPKQLKSRNIPYTFQTILQSCVALTVTIYRNPHFPATSYLTVEQLRNTIVISFNKPKFAHTIHHHTVASIIIFIEIIIFFYVIFYSLIPNAPIPQD